MALSETSGPDAAWGKIAKAASKNEVDDLSERLADHYIRQGRQEYGITTLERLLSKSPFRDRNPDILFKVLALYEEKDRTNEFMTTVGKIRQLLDQKSPWRQANTQNTALIQGAEDLAEQKLSRYGFLFHSRSLKTSNAGLRNLAIRVYSNYLELFSKRPTAPEVEYQLAEALAANQDWREAWKHYYAVSRNSKTGPKHLKPSAFGAVAAANKTLQTVRDTAKPITPPMTPAPLGKEAAQVVLSVDNYARLFPGDPEALPMLYTAATLNLEVGQIDAARKRFANIVKVAPSSSQASESVRVLAETYSKRKAWEDAWSWCLQNEAAPLSPDGRKVVVSCERTSLLMLAKTNYDENSYSKAREQYTLYTKKFPNVEDTDSAMYNAFVCSEKDHAFELVVSDGETLLKTYPKSKHRLPVLASLAEIFESTAEFEKSALMNMQFAGESSKASDQINALRNAALLFRGMSKFDESIAAFTRMGEIGKGDVASREALLEIARTYEAATQWERAAVAYQALSKAATGHDKAMNASAEVKRVEMLHKVDPERNDALIVSLSRPLLVHKTKLEGGSRKILGEVLFERTNLLMSQFESISMERSANLNKYVEAKQSHLEKLGAALVEIAQLGDGDSVVASLFRLGEAHESFAISLSENAGDKIDKKLVNALQAEANRFFESACTKAEELPTTKDWNEKCIEKMNKLNPGRYGEPVIATAEAGYVTADFAALKEKGGKK